MIRNFILKHEKGVLRTLEILPGLVSWNIILFPYWGVFIIPTVTAYFILLFNIYWFYNSFQIAITSMISHFRIQAWMQYDWMKDVETFPDWKKVHHIIIIPEAKEPVHILERAIDTLVKQDFPQKQMTVVVAMEKRVPIEDREFKMKLFKKKYGKIFGNLYFTHHELVAGETIGKHSNQRFAAIWVKEELIDKQKMDMNYITVTSCDSDHIFHPKHFSSLTFKFLDSPSRYSTFWQPAVMFYTNIWKLPALTRVNNTLGTIWNLSLLPRRDKLINGQNYTLSLKLLDEAGYWDPDKIPEDWGIFFKAFYKKAGKVEVEPLYLPLYADAPLSTSFLKTIKSQYNQYMRWAWGVSDTPWIIRSFLLNPKMSFLNKLLRLKDALWTHIMWPVNWFIITIGLTLPTLINPAFGRTVLGYTVPKLSSFILTVSLGFLVVMLFIDRIYKPARPKEFPLWRAIIMPLEFVLMPITGLIFSALPGLDAHTRLMMGRYIQYKVTEKV